MNQSLILNAESAEKLSKGITEGKLAYIREILSKKDEITGMPLESVEKLAKFAESTRAHGGCGIGCW